MAVRKQAAQKSNGGRLNLRKLNDLEVRKQYQIEMGRACGAYGGGYRGTQGVGGEA